MTGSDEDRGRLVRPATLGTRRGFVAAVLAVSFLVSGGARAEAPGAAGDGKRAAQAHLDRGNDLFTHDRFQQALEEFQAAFALFPSPKLRFNLGQCERALGHGPAAAAEFRHFLDEAGDVPPALRAEAERYLAEAPAPADTTAAPVTPQAAAPAPARPPALLPPTLVAAAPSVSLPATPPPPNAAPPPRPLLRRWWVWTTVGAVVVGGALTAFILTRPRDPCDGMLCVNAQRKNAP